MCYFDKKYMLGTSIILEKEQFGTIRCSKEDQACMKHFGYLVCALFLLLFLTGCWRYSDDSAAPSAAGGLPEETSDPATSLEETSAPTIISTEEPRQTEPVSYSGATWQDVYRQIILSDPRNYLAVELSPEINMEDRQLYLGIHDYDCDGTPELIIGDSWAAAVFTYADGQAKKLANLCIPNTVWCINGLHARGNSISVHCDGAGGGDFVNFGFGDGEYVLGIYTGLSNDYDPPLINGKTGTIDQMNRIYPTDYASYSEDDLKEMVHLVRKGDDWTIHLPSGEIVTLDESFDFGRFLWE